MKNFKKNFMLINGLIFACSVSLSYSIEVNIREQQLIDHVKWGIEQAKRGISKLTPAVLQVPGMTSPWVKHFLNNMCSLPQTTYLEIGVFKGATFTAALYANTESIKQAVAIDNWSEFQGPAQEFNNNCQAFISNISYQFYANDCFTINKNGLFDAPIEIYFFDGNHSAEAQEKAFTYYDSLFASSFIAIVDDWNYEEVKTGTREAFKKLGYSILYERILPGTGREDNWWNGLYVAVVRRNS